MEEDSVAGDGSVLLWWDEPVGAAGYLLAFAPYPDAEEVYTIDLGSQTETRWSFWAQDRAFYVAILPYDSQDRPGDLSNIEVIFASQAGQDLTDEGSGVSTNASAGLPRE